MSDGKDQELKKKDSTAPAEKDHWEFEKSRLEVQKLTLELANYGDRLALEDKKLKSDLKDWYLRSLIAIVTAVATGAGFFLGQFYESRKDDKKVQAELALQREREEMDAFSKSVAALSSTDIGQRALAAGGLMRYVHEPADKGVSGEDIAARQLAEWRLQQILDTVEAILPSETDPVLLEQYSRMLAAAPNHSLSYVVQINRDAGSQFARSAGVYVGWRLPKPAKFQPQGCQPDSENAHNVANQRVVEQVLGDADLVARNQVRGVVNLEGVGTVTASFNVRSLLKGRPLMETFQRACREIVNLRSDEKQGDTANQLTRTSDGLARAGRILSFSSLTLNWILHKLDKQLAVKDLSNIFLINGRLDDTDCSFANLSGSYLVGSPKNFTCRGCNFTGSDLSQFYPLKPFNFDGWKHDGAILSDTLAGLP